MSNFDILIKNGRIWNGIEFLIAGDSVAIKDGIIAKIGSISDDEDVVIDAKSSIISPGLVDIHTHIKGCSCDDFGVPIEAVCYPNGVTTVADASAENIMGKTHLDNMWLNSYVFIATNVKDNTFDSNRIDALLNAYQDMLWIFDYKR